MVYGRNSKYNNEDIEEMKRRIKSQMPEVDVDNISQDQMKNILMEQINNNPNLNISEDVKNKINNGDIEGLRNELIQYLDKQDSANSQRLSNMLKNNDFEGLKQELMGMLIKGMSGQKKNEVDDDKDKRVENSNYENPLLGLFDEALLNNIIERFLESNKNDKRIILLNSLKPFVSERRQKALDDCVKAMNIIAILEKLGFKAGR